MHISIGMNEYLVNSSFRILNTILWGYLVYLPKNLYARISVVLLLSLNKNFWINTSQFIFFPGKTEIQTTYKKRNSRVFHFISRNHHRNAHVKEKSLRNFVLLLEQPIPEKTSV